MLTIRLIRTGKRNAPTFRIVLIQKTAPPKSGKFLEILGNYNPRLSSKESSCGKELNLKKDRLKYWISQGVGISDTVHNLLVSEGVIKGPKIKKRIRTKKKEAEERKQKKKKEPEKTKSATEPKEEIKEEKDEKKIDKSPKKSKIKEE